ncbi:hypothetical protein HanRHA438_Chr16g0766511 [Helianthus annuus]|nr:hypothetical protein HanRHA438_Chr16g0766511 [Helianthus annuus]
MVVRHLILYYFKYRTCTKNVKSGLPNVYRPISHAYSIDRWNDTRALSIGGTRQRPRSVNPVVDLEKT